MYFATTTTAACSSTSQPAPNAVLVSIEKCEDSPNKGIFVELGELGNSGLQPSCLLPSTVLDSITVMSKEICSSKSLNPGENERSCKAKRGHTYDPESSKSWSEVQGGFPERPENFFKSLNHTWRSGMETVRIDTATEDQKVIEQAEVIAVTAGKNSTMGSFPIGPYSYVMKRMEWEEFGLYGGSQFRLQDSVPGALTLGGYDGSRVKGTPYKFPVNNETAEGRICPFRVPINNLVVRFIEEGKDATEVPLMDEVAETIACVEPLDVLFRFPRTIMRDWLEATEHDNRIRNETVPQGWQYPEPGLVYSNNSKIQTAELVIRLEQGLEITIPNEELVRKLVGMDGNGEYKVIDDGPEGLWESAIFDNVKDSGIVPNNTMTLGMIFLSQAGPNSSHSQFLQP